MQIETIVGSVVIGLLTAAAAFAGGFFVRKFYAERLIRTAESKAREILVGAKREGEETKRRAEKDANQHLHKTRSEFETKLAERRREIENREKMVKHKEGTLDEKLSLAEKKEREALFRLQESANKEKTTNEREREAERLVAEQKKVLEKMTAIDPEAARKEFMNRLESELREEAGRRIREAEARAKEESDDKARKILSLAIQRCAATLSMEATTTVVPLPNEEMKGRIIGKDGRNIRTFETQTGVDLVIDDTPIAVTLSAFDGVRREIARRSLSELIEDGRINPARIEEVVQKNKRGMETVLKEEGEKALSVVSLTNVHPEMVKLIGRLRFRSSYGQNVLDHSIEVAFLMNVIAGEMGLDPVFARRAGLLHDIGKGVSSDVEGPHALIGGELARRYGEHPDVVHGIEAHHEDIEVKSIWPLLVQAADAVSAARPGARRESLENYVKRLKQLEEIADKYPGVEKSFAIQGGREVRVLVQAGRVPEDAMPTLAREIAKKIQTSLQFPGQIKVIAIRETRVEDVAK